MNISDDSAGTLEVFGRLMDLIRTLRSEDGCPWDRKQTPRNFHPYILEEYHELVQAIHQGSAGEIVDEIGDLLFLVVFLAYMFEQEGFATLREIIEGVRSQNDSQTSARLWRCSGERRGGGDRKLGQD